MPSIRTLSPDWLGRRHWPAPASAGARLPASVLQPTPENLYFATEELDAVHKRAKAAVARELSATEKRPWGERSFYCLDPDGNRLCFVDETTVFLGRGAAWS